MDEEENITRRATRIKSLKDIYDNREDENDTITKVTGMYKDWFLDYASYGPGTCSCN
jgi:topoisomerase-4 subunit A